MMDNPGWTYDDDFVFTTPDLRIEPSISIGEILFDCMNKNKSNVAQVDTQRDEQETYEKMLERCVRSAKYLQSKGVSEGDGVGICSFANVHCAVLFVAGQFIGATVSATDVKLSREVTAHCLKMSKPKVLFVSPEVIELIEGALHDASLSESTEIIVLGESDKYTQFEDILHPYEEEELFKPTVVNNLKDIAIICFSSGSTGLPKGVLISHYALVANIMLFKQVINDADPTFDYCNPHPSAYLQLCTMYAISSYINVCLSIAFGNSRVLVTKFDARKVWRIIDKYKVNYTYLIPYHLRDMYAVGRPSDVDTSSLRSVFVGGYLITKECMMQIRELLPNTTVCQVYAQTEFVGRSIGFKLNGEHQKNAFHNKPEAMGFPTEGMNLKVVDVETEKNVGANKYGELRVKSRFLMSGYYGMDTSNLYDSDGWFKTGDIVYYDEEGCFFFVERKSQIINCRFGNVIPANIEKVLLNHPDIQEAIVIGVPYDGGDDIPMAVVSLREKSKLTPEDVEEYVRSRVEVRERLRGGVKVVDKMPLTPTDKVLRREIKIMVLDGKL